MSGESKAGPTVRMVPEGDDRERLVCLDCGHIHYENPKITVGAVCTWEDKLLLCRRAIEPRPGFWTIPAGYLEESETTAEGAAREIWEEARARVKMDGLFGIYEIPHISQIYMIYRARMIAPDCAPGPESADAALVLLGRHPVGGTGLSQRLLGAPGVQAGPGRRRPLQGTRARFLKTGPSA